MNKILTLIFVLASHIVFSQHIVLEAPVAPVLDGKVTESFWGGSDWHDIKYLIVDNVSGTQNSLPSAQDFSGKYKMVWKGNQLFFLVEVTDDILSYKTFDPSKPGELVKDDNVEIFLDENKSGGAHTKTHNAFAFHISASGNTTDQCGCGKEGDYSGNAGGDWNGRLFNNVVQSKWVKTGTTYVWEIAITVYTDAYKDGVTDNSAALATLYPGKIMGYGLAYNDNDKTNLSDPNYDRDHMISGFSVPGNNNGTYGTAGGRNVAWQDASVFGSLQLATITGVAGKEYSNQPAFYSNQNHTLYLLDEFADMPVSVISAEGKNEKCVAGNRGEYLLQELNPGIYVVRIGEYVMKIAVQ